MDASPNIGQTGRSIWWPHHRRLLRPERRGPALPRRPPARHGLRRNDRSDQASGPERRQPAPRFLRDPFAQARVHLVHSDNKPVQIQAEVTPHPQTLSRYLHRLPASTFTAGRSDSSSAKCSRNAAALVPGTQRPGQSNSTKAEAMSRATRIATVVGLPIGLAALAGPSLAAAPMKAGKYIGQWNKGPIGPYPHKVIVNVSKDGKSAKATLYCQGRRIDATSRFAITKAPSTARRDSGPVRSGRSRATSSLPARRPRTLRSSRPATTRIHGDSCSPGCNAGVQASAPRRKLLDDRDETR